LTGAPVTANGGGAAVGVAVPAAGLGERMGGVRKQYLELAGEPVLLWSIRPFLVLRDVVAVAVALPKDDLTEPPDFLLDLDPRVVLVPGGDTRRDSVWSALQALPGDAGTVVVHDGARPLVSKEVIDECIRVAREGVGAVAGCPAVDTLKRVREDRRIVDTPDRTELWHAQTPQAFPRSVLENAYMRAIAEDWPATDDSGLVERAGGEVVMVSSPARNLKVTRPEDLALAELLLDLGRP